jgi:LuxR family maltose regulon positive regulatory protein
VALASDAVSVSVAATVENPLTVARATAPRLATGSLRAKYRAPRLREQHVRRAELLRLLQCARERPLALLTAPAGYGKTTVLSQWAREAGRPVAWVTLDRSDGDREVLAHSIECAVARVGMRTPGASPEFLLVVDDAHVVPPDVLRDAVLGVLSWLPEGSQLALASRCEPSLPLGRMRADRMLVQARADDLAMSAVEAASLLQKAGLDLELTAVQS